ncbi:hypothetical protein ATCC90586_010082 [Pythium insidiosum]|nr:hypothetical protein ATCC90586_010082 [Pythium insidiosum]
MLPTAPVKTANLFQALSASSAPPAQPAACAGEAAATGNKKKKKKKNKAAHKGLEQDTESHASSDTRSEDTEHDREPPTATLPLAQRLEIAASHADLHAALVGLVGWSRLYIGSDTVVMLFQSRALELLFENILKSRPTADAIFANLTTLLSNCLVVSSDGKPTASHENVAAAVVTSLRALIEQLHHEQQDADDPATSVATVAAYLAKLLVTYRLSLNGVALESSISQEVLSIEAQLAAAASRDGGVKGQTIRESFQRRDIRSDALELYETRLKKVTQLVVERAGSRSSQTVSLSAGEDSTDCRGAQSGFLLFALQGEASESLAHVDSSEIETVNARQQELEERKINALAPVEKKRAANNARLAELERQREALEAQLRAVNQEIQEAQDVEVALEADAAAVVESFQVEVTRFHAEHERILSWQRRQEQRTAVDNAFATLERAIATISETQNEVQSLREKQIVCLRQQLEGALRFFGSELPCVKFMRSRIQESETKLTKLEEEAKGYESLGVGAVAQELLDKAEELQHHIEEDRQCVATLQRRDLEVVAMLERVLRDDTLRDAVNALDEGLKKEVGRHIEYVKSLYSDVMINSSVERTNNVVDTSG